MELRSHCSRGDTPNLSFQAWNRGGGYTVMRASAPFSTSDQWVSYDTNNASTIIDSNGTALLRMCGCPVSGNQNNYTLSLDVVRLVLTFGAPPVANFSGTPTTGNKPLSVTFTDSSTNSPTSWSWNFGDSNTSTAQNPSHQYTSAGKYTVALTATNQYGNNTCTKTNYIVVSGDFTANSATLDSGLQTSGTYASTQVADGTFWVIDAAKVSNKYQDQETYTMNTGMSSLSAITISTKGKINTGTQTEKIYLYNYSTSTYDLKQTVTLNTTNTLSTQTVSSAANYMSGGTVKVQVYVGGTGSSIYTHSTDFVSINCTP